MACAARSRHRPGRQGELAVILPGRDDRCAGDEAGRKALDLHPHRAIEPVPAEHVDGHGGVSPCTTLAAPVLTHSAKSFSAGAIFKR